MNKEIIFKYLRGETDQNENIDVLEWIESDSEHRKLFMQYRRMYDMTIWMGTDQAKITERSNFFNRFLSAKQWMKVAAVLAVVVSMTLLMQRNFMHRERIYTQTIEVPSGQRVNLTLSDGTKVSLNSNTRMHFPSVFVGKQRRVVLDGEGFFEVAHDNSKPFIVETQKYNIKVLGTTFNVLAYSETDIFETSLLKGSVEVEKSGLKKGIVLNPNERVFLRADQLVKTTFESHDDFLWRNGIYVFKNESLVDVFKKLEQYYQVKIEIKNKHLVGYNCTAKFRQKDGIEDIIKVLQKANNFKFECNDDRNIYVIY